MRFYDLLDALPDVLARPSSDAAITAPVSEDTRTLERGGLFVARRGLNRDGHDLIPSAIDAGAVAIVGERPPETVHSTVPYAQVGDATMAIGRLASAYYGYPSRHMTVIGVTGTDGKTTTTSLVYAILKAAGQRAGMISTVSAVIGDEELATGLHTTTPNAPEVQMYLRRMVDAGLTHAVLETTSHGLAQGRVSGVEYDIAVLTNVTHEHLDFHGTFENYRAAKGMLFAGLATSFRKPGIGKTAIINADDPNAAYFLNFPADRHWTYSLSRAAATLSASAIEHTPGGMRITLRGLLDVRIETRLVGNFNVQNLLAAALAGAALGCSPQRIKTGLESMPPVPGRMERIDEGQNFIAIVDFAHTPNALAHALQAARTMIPPDRRVIAVFGSAGLRDREKRRLMAEVSAQLADISVFTAEDPRTESLDAILATMAEAATGVGGVEGQTFYRVPDRGAALACACSLARPGDLVIACGKGHEQSMAFGLVEYPWDDREALRSALRGQPLTTLPTAGKQQT
ncbi:MAG TPA: UDP-N-acetylmuramoyl-L-alanyl-D-glutamate--2,6-diaminopimelate ligase [Aggregatilineales bacterium]|nr:UDP-N-acetylmuramoyl-L-alanyl-D-glutamate--2,6-diaminopimelate ligase [Aggregatilineales bacterium]